MTIESLLERIAIALEAGIASQAIQTTPAHGGLGADMSKSYVDRRLAELNKEVKPRGRPAAAKVLPKEEPKEEVLPAVAEPEQPAPIVAAVPVLEDNFLEDAPATLAVEAPVVEAPPVTIEDVREALKALRDRSDKTVAMGVLASAGNGATCLPGSGQAGKAGSGQLQPEFYAAVLAAVKKA